jgi:inward rectifier potassium channel
MHQKGKSSIRRITIGPFTVETSNREAQPWRDTFHFFMTVSWPALFAIMASVFIALNLFFALLYIAVPGSVANLNPPNLLGAFFFSVETIATVGYGDMHPGSLYGHLIASIEIFFGIVSVSGMTGVMFARFSRPRAMVVFADVSVIAPIEGKQVLMIRAANSRQNIVMETTAQLRLVRQTRSGEDFMLRRVDDLKLVRSDYPVFIFGWNLIHIIDESSPLAGETLESLKASRAMINLTLSGTDEATGQVLMARHHYEANAIRFNLRYREMLTRTPDGIDHLDYSMISLVDPIEPTHSPSSSG